MDSREIDCVCGAVPTYAGCFSFNTVPRLQYPTSYIVNILRDDEQWLGHWVAFWASRRYYWEFFDSFGRHPAECGFNGNYLYHTNQLQTNDSVLCGEFACCFLHWRNSYTPFSDILQRFSKNLQKNEEEVVYFLSAYTNYSDCRLTNKLLSLSKYMHLV